MSRSQLHDGEMAVLARLNRQPVELGDLPCSAVARLTELGLARKVLGSCEITRAGQLTYQRYQYRNGSMSRMARRSPFSLLRRRTFDTQMRDVSFARKWMTRLSGAASK